MSSAVTLVGRVGADPDIRFGANGKAIAALRVVTSARRLNKETNAWEDADTTWWSVKAFGPLAEKLSDQINKGTAVIVLGKAREESFVGRDGQQRTAIAVIADHVGLDLRWSGVKAEKPEDITDDPWAVLDPAHAPF